MAKPDETPKPDYATIVACDIPVDETIAAILSNRSVSWLQKVRTTGGGPPFIKGNRRVSYFPSKLREWMAAQEVGSTSEADEQKKQPPRSNPSQCRRTRVGQEAVR